MKIPMFQLLIKQFPTREGKNKDSYENDPVLLREVNKERQP